MMHGEYYRPSGKVGVVGLVGMMVAGALTALIGGVVYALAIFYCPFIYINFFLTLGFGAAIGAVVGAVAKATKVRNVKVACILGTVLGLVGTYVQWVVWIHVFVEAEKIAIIMPGDLFLLLQAIAAEGAWNLMGGWTPTGFFLWAVWFIEAAMIIGCAALLPAATIGDDPFCEDCGVWTELDSGFGHMQAFVGPDAEQLAQSLESGQTDKLLTRDVADPSEATMTSKVQIASCPQCQEAHFLTVNNIVETVDNEGKPKTEVSPVIKHLQIDSNARQTIADQWRLA